MYEYSLDDLVCQYASLTIDDVEACDHWHVLGLGKIALMTCLSCKVNIFGVTRTVSKLLLV